MNRNEVIGLCRFYKLYYCILDEHFEPLHRHDNFKSNPHAYVKLWKHHGAQDEATQMVEVNQQRIRTGLIIMVQASIVNG